MKDIWLLTGITIKEGLRNKVLIGILFFALLMCGLNFIVTSSFTRDLGKVAVDVGLSTVSVSGLAIIFFLGMPMFSKDLDKLTVYMVLSRPISRSTYIIGKFIGLVVLVLVSVFILSLLTGFTVLLIMKMNSGYIPELFSWKIFAYAVLLSGISLCVTASLSFLFTCLSSSPFIALILTAGSYVIGQNVEMFREIINQSNTENTSMNFLMNIASWLFPNLAVFDRKTVAAYGLDLGLREMFITSAYGVSYVLCILFFTVLVFNKRELT